MSGGRRLRIEDLAGHRQIVVASRDPEQQAPRFLQAHRHWRTDNHTAALSLMQCGLGCGLLPYSLVQPYLAAGSQVQVELDNVTDAFHLWVDVVWSNSRPLGLGARHFIELMRARPPRRPV
ncbi:LysR substrate-binding domain-containing protein [Pseudomonas sp. BN102]|uniref:LysR substrate-binding domain-containing protein n=1 Tax=Pseudomonas sp. BN102 TaxID=2567886 RepID=UPI0024563A28|nr:LysR substrate-binding domain-containing protein [Pseudomonas sp. BN102]